MKKVLITGCNGQLGRALNQLLADDKEVVIINTDVDTLDICDLKQVREMFRRERPDTVLNCAAHTAVDKCEVDQENAYRINAIGPKNLAIASKEVGAVMVQVSTDYVFAGNANTPYLESDTTDPQSVYGSTKLAGEKFVMEENEKCFIFRTAWLYGDGNNFVKTMLRLSENNSQISVIMDQLGSPTSALELGRMMLYVVLNGEYGIYHATCEGSTSWYEFAVEIFRQAGKEMTVKPVTTEEYTAMYPAQAKRPSYSILENEKLNQMGSYRMKNWQDALTEYMVQAGFAK